MVGLLELLGDAVPIDHANQIHVSEALAAQLRATERPRLLDLGCGDGRAIDILNKCNRNTHYSGIDIESSPEVESRARSDAEFSTFDGVNIPFPDAQFDIVYSSSVLEHVRFPDRLLPEVTRVLKPEGIFLGSVSFLEPYHSFSMFNFTPYGLKTVLNDAGLNVLWMRPGIDGLTLTIRSLGFHRQFNRWFHSESPLNKLIGLRKRARRASIAEQNAAKLSVAGHIIFAATRAGRVQPAN